MLLTGNAVHGAAALPDTNDTTRRASAAPVPGWINAGGSCDTSDANYWGWSSAAWANGSWPPPTDGHTYFMSCGSWGEGATGTISGLTPGADYVFTFYVAGFQSSDGYGARVSDQYQITVGNESSGTVAFDSEGWLLQRFVFTADSSSETITVFTPSKSPYGMTHYSFGGDAIRLDNDSDFDGISDLVEGLVNDTDGDGVPDYLDTDSDGDTIPDGTEDTRSPQLLGDDSNNNGIDDAIDSAITGGVDSNGDGVDDLLQPSDSDDDGVANHLDLDSDNDGIPDAVEGHSDRDGDGFGDYLDPDSDGDTLFDSQEAVPQGSSSLDADNNGVISLSESGGFGSNGLADALETSVDSGHPDYDGDGSGPDVPAGAGVFDFQAPDTDSDGVNDLVDIDDDNDGLADTTEDLQIAQSADFQSTSGWTLNGVSHDASQHLVKITGDTSGSVSQTLPSGYAVTSAEFSFGWNNSISSGTSGLSSTLTVSIGGTAYASLTTFDGSDGQVAGSPNGAGYAHLSFLNGAIGDVTGNDASGDTHNGYDIPATTYLAWLPQTRVRIYLPEALTSDGQVFEIGFPDMSGDDFGIHSVGVYSSADTDSDAVPDRMDLDSDNDGISDLFESADAAGVADDANGDGFIEVNEGVDTDVDGLMDVFEDGDLTINEGSDPVDTDSDGLPDYRDLDSDSDAIPDTIEARATAGYVGNDGDVGDDDNDGDGVIALFDDNDSGSGAFGGGHVNFIAPVDTDSDNTPDYRDTDSDGDTALDATEAGTIATPPVYSDPDGSVDDPATLDNELGDDTEVAYRETLDSDGDGISDKADLDDDNDGIPDTSECIVDSIEPHLTASATAYAAASADQWVAITKAEYDAMAAGVAGTSVFGTAEAYTKTGTHSNFAGDAMYTFGQSSNPSGTGVTVYAFKRAGASAMSGDDDSVRLSVSSNGSGFTSYGSALPAATVDNNESHWVLKAPTVVQSSPVYLGLSTNNNSSIYYDASDTTGRYAAGSVSTVSSYYYGWSMQGLASTDLGSAAACTTDIDTDGDGLVDRLDIDSDNDYRFDSQEAVPAGTVSLDTDNDGVISEAEAGGFGVNGLADNLETSIDSGVVDYDGDGNGPDAPTGGGTPDFQLKDVDGDGVSDADDIDDDNDGISDFAEQVGFIDSTGVSPVADGLEDTADYPQGYWNLSYYAGHSGVSGSSWPAAVQQNGAAGSPTFYGESTLGWGQQVSEAAPNGSAPDGRWASTETPTSPLLPTGYVGSSWSASNSDYQIDYRRTMTADGTLSIGGASGDVVDDIVVVQVNGITRYAYWPSGGAPDPRPGESQVARVELNADDEVLIRFINLGGIGGMKFSLVLRRDVDTDSDGIVDRLDSDSDNDSITDLVESGHSDGIALDVNGDGKVSAAEGADADADGMADVFESGNSGGNIGSQPVNSDTDTLADFRDVDSDADGLADSAEGAADTDGDGKPDYLDIDSDNDGITDANEGPPPIASTFSFVSSTAAATASLTSAASSGFGVALISADEGVLQLSASSPAESSFDSVSSARGTIARSTVTLLRDASEVLETYSLSLQTAGGFDDGLYLEVDGVVVIEFTEPDWSISDVRTMYGGGAGWTPWTNQGNPALQLLIDNTGDASVALMVDRTDTPGVRDNILDVIPGAAPNAMPELNIEDGIEVGIAFRNASGAGGLSAVTLSASATFASNQSIDTDGDTIADFVDLDSDNDGIDDLYEAANTTGIAADANRDGIVSASEGPDTDTDGLVDLFEGADLTTDTGVDPVDSDGDSLADYRDLDSDGDGLPDAIEAQPTATYAASYGNDGDVRDDDSDGDGVLDVYDVVAGFGGSFSTPLNTDGTDEVDYLDLDSDNDTASDAVENASDVTVAASYADPDGNIDDPAVDFSNEGGDTTEVAYREDATAPGAPVITVTEDSNNDGYINQTELSGQTDLSITLPVDALAGHVLRVADNSNSTSITLNASQVSAGVVSTALAAPADGSTQTYTATVTDNAGNTSLAGSDMVMVDLTQPSSPVVVLTEDSSNDGLINSTELDGLIDVTITLPVNAAAGDTVSVSNGVTTNTLVLSAGDVSTGSVATTFTAGSDGDTLLVTASMTDVSGNVSGSASDSAGYDISATAAPSVVIDEDLNNDALISLAELTGVVNVTATLPVDAVAGDTVHLDDGDTTNSLVLSASDITAGTVAATFVAGNDGDTLTVTASVTDAAGNLSATSIDTAVYDLAAPTQPLVTITEDSDDNALIGLAELSGNLDVAIALPVDVVAGDTLAISDGSTTNTILISSADVTAGAVSSSFTSGGDGQSVQISASITDIAGNTSSTSTDNASYDLVATAAPTVLITEDLDDNALVSLVEAVGDTDVQVTVPADAVVGDVLQISDGSTTSVTTLVSADITAGVVSAAFTAPGDGGSIIVSAGLTDRAGNTSASGSDSASYDLSAPDAPVVVLTEDNSNDGLISQGELSGQIDVTVTLPANAVAGDTLNVGDGSTTVTIVLTAGDISSGVVTTGFVAGSDGDSLTVTATVSDASGNSSSLATDSASYDITAPNAPTVTLTEDTNNDSLISATELSGDINVTVALPVDAVAGDTVAVSDGSITHTLVLLTADISTGSVFAVFSAGADTDLLTVTADVTDVAGNQSVAGSDFATYDLSPASIPVIVIDEDTDNNALIGAAELSANLDVTVVLPADAAAGDTLVIGDGSSTNTVLLTSGDITAGQVSASFAAGADGDTVTVTATITDVAGNLSAAASDMAGYDLTAPGIPLVLISDDLDNNALVSAVEAVGDTDAQVTLPADAVAGDVVSVSDGSASSHILLQTADVSAGSISVSFAPPADGGSVTVTAMITDLAGNTSATASDTAVYDLSAPSVPVIQLTEDAGNDGLISSGELSGPVDVTVTLPVDVNAGDTLRVSDGSVTNAILITSADIASGSVVTSFASGSDGDSLTVTAVVVDPSGNSSATASDAAVYDLTAPAAPVVVISEDSNNDALISGVELTGDSNITVALPGGDAVAGDAVVVSDGSSTNTIVLTAADIAAAMVTTTFSAGSHSDALTVTAVLTDMAGNQSASHSDTAVFDLAAPGIPVILITEDTDNNGLIGVAELAGALDVSVTLPADVVAGDTLIISDGISSNSVLLSASDLSAGTVAGSFSAGVDGDALTVSAVITDIAGNSSASASDSISYDLTAPSAALVTLTEDADDNGLVSITEALGVADVRVTLPVDAVAGDTVTVSDGSASNVITLQTADITNGVVNTSFSAPANGGSLVISAVVTDIAGNVSTSAGDNASYDLSAPSLPVVELQEDTSNDGLINSAELSGQVDVIVTLPADAVSGDTVQVSDGLSTTSIVLSAGDIANGSVTTAFASGNDGGSIALTATVTDAAGNRSAVAGDSADYDLTAPSTASLVITEDSNDDALINVAELSGDINVLVSLPVDAVAGDTVTVDDGVTSNVIVLGVSDISAAQVATTFAAGNDTDTLTITASVTDIAGNQSLTTTDSARYDLSAPTPSVVVIAEDTDNNGLISITELSGVLDVTVQLSADAVAGDSLMISDGNTVQTVLLSGTDISNGSVSSVFSPGSHGDTVTATAAITDIAGNTSTNATDTAGYDLLAPAGAVVLITEDNDNNGLIGSEEYIGAVDVIVTLPADAVAGDTLSVSDGATTSTFVLTATQVSAASVASSFTGSVDGDVFSVTARLTDVAGNPSVASDDTATFDLVAPALVGLVIAEDSNNDGMVSVNENSGQADVTISLAADVVSGDLISVTDGLTTNSIVVTMADIGNGFAGSSFSPPASGSVLAVTATVTDAAGNQSVSVGDSAIYDLSSPDVPVVVLSEDTSNDGLINNAELSGRIDVTVTLPTNAAAGDIVTVSDGSTDISVTLSAPDINAGLITTRFDAGTHGDTVTVTATVTDPSGNRSASASDSASYDTTAPSAAVVVITEDTNNDGLVSIAEHSGRLDVTVTLPVDAVSGDTVTLDDATASQSVVLSSSDISAGEITLDVTAGVHAETVVITASVTDLAGNQSASGSDTVLYDLAAPAMGVVSISEDSNNDGLISLAEQVGAVDIVVALPADAVTGDTLQVSDGTATNTVVLSAADINSGTVATSVPAGDDGDTLLVSAMITDIAGNPSTSASDSALHDLAAPGAPVVTITEDFNNDQLVSAAEAVGDTDVLITLPVDAVVGDIVFIDDGASVLSQLLTSADLTAGTVAGAFASPADGGVITVTASVIDSAGNPSLASTDTATYDLTEPAIPVVRLVEDISGDGFINAAELQGDIDVAIILPLNAVAGDTVTISDGSTTVTQVLSAADITAGVVSTAFAAGNDGDAFAVTAIVTDVSGNSSGLISHSAGVDISAPSVPSVVITEDGNSDSLISRSELITDLDVTITLPADAVAGDTLEIDNGTVNNTVMLSASDIITGSINSSFIAGSDSDTVVVTASVTDIAGNQSVAATASATYDLSAPAAPVIVIVEDAGNDGLISIAELDGAVDLAVTLPVDVVAGDALSISDGHTTFTHVLTAADISAGVVLSTTPAGSDTDVLLVSVFATDSAGNSSAAVSDNASYDLSAPGDVTITISEDLNSDGLVSSAEASGDADIQINLPVDAQVGDSVIVSDGAITRTRVLQLTDITAGVVASSFSAPADGALLSVTARVTDVAGNSSLLSSRAATYDLSRPGVPVIVVSEDASNDGWINASELQGDIDISVTLPVDATVGDTVTISDGLATTTLILTGTDINAGYVTTTVVAGGHGETLLLTATVTDVSGNSSTSATNHVVYDITPPSIPMLLIAEDSNGDGLINQAELSGDIDLVITLPVDAVAGDTLNIDDSVTTNTMVLSAQDIADSTVDTSFSAGTDADTVSFSVMLTDIAGNQSLVATESAIVDLAAPDSPVIVIAEDTDNDGLINLAELNGDIDVTVSLPSDAVTGDTVAVSDGITTQRLLLAGGDIAAGNIATIFAAGNDDEVLEVTVSVTDIAGNRSSATSDTARYDLSAPVAPVVAISEDLNDDGLVSSAEAIGDTDILIGLAPDAEAGDWISVSDGQVSQQITLSTSDITTGGVSVLFPAPLDGGAISIAATLTDVSGNVSLAGTDTAVYDLTDPGAPVILLSEDFSDDGLISRAELDGNIDVTILLPADAVAGDSVTVSDGTDTVVIELTGSDLLAGRVTATFDAGADGDAVSVTATLTDLSGNRSTTARDSARYDITAPGMPVISIAGDSNNDGMISSGELNGDIAVLVELPDNALAGESAEIDNASVTSVRLLSAADIASGFFVTTFEAGADTEILVVSAVLIDAAGNRSATASDSASYDLSAPTAPMVTIAQDRNNNGYISYPEFDITLTVVVRLPDDTVAGDTLTVTDSHARQSFVLTTENINAGTLEAAFTAARFAETLFLTAELIDPLGNTSVPATVTAEYDLNSDSDADSIPDRLEGSGDSDADGTPDYLDTDSDNDGIPDLQENGRLLQLLNSDSDNDGIDDALDADFTAGPDRNNNGIDDALEPTDSDADGIANYYDLDSDNDGVLDAVERASDTDIDGIPDFLDTDSDNDGLTDTFEAGISVDLAIDSNGRLSGPVGSNGLADALETSVDNGFSDYNGDGIIDSPVDTDADGTADYRDSDSDNDGISDLTEAAGQSGTLDTDADGLPNHLDSDSDADGIADALEGGGDTDADGIADYRDGDSDNDSIPDLTESSIDSDGDGLPDYRDTDADNDGIEDSIEAGDALGFRDTDADGIADHLDTDADGDNISDLLEGGGDSDADGLPDYLDTDSDNDGLPDLEEHGLDSDGDGIADSVDTDSDNDGIPDGLEGSADSDADGLPNYLDTDSDNDTLPDAIEGRGDTDGDGIPDAEDVDSDNDSIADIIEATYLGELPADFDGDTIPDYLDLDTDNDSITDQQEGSDDRDLDGAADFRDLDVDDDGILDLFESHLGVVEVALLDLDGDGVIDGDVGHNGLADAVETTMDSGLPNFLLADFDGDSVPDYRDHDSDNDGILDTLESDHPDDNLDGLIDEPLPLNDDRIVLILSDRLERPDGLAANAGGIPPNSDNVGLADYRDLDSDNDGLTDVIEVLGPQHDSDRDGVLDAFIDSDGDGTSDRIDVDGGSPGGVNNLSAQGGRIALRPPVDSDRDGVSDFRDVDSDQDGITDLAESGGIDADGNGQVDRFIDEDDNGLDDNAGNTVAARDLDGDGAYDYIDIDSDGDGIFDIVEAGFTDANGDGIADQAADHDGDGIADSVDVDLSGGMDLDGDSIDDRFDADFSPESDLDGDGLIDSADADADGDGFTDPGELIIAAALPQVVVIGLDGRGCLLGPATAQVDPTLVILLLLSLAGLRGRCRTVNRHNSKYYL